MILCKQFRSVGTLNYLFHTLELVKIVNLPGVQYNCMYMNILFFRETDKWILIGHWLVTHRVISTSLLILEWDIKDQTCPCLPHKLFPSLPPSISTNSLFSACWPDTKSSIPHSYAQDAQTSPLQLTLWSLNIQKDCTIPYWTFYPSILISRKTRQQLRVSAPKDQFQQMMTSQQMRDYYCSMHFND